MAVAVLASLAMQPGVAAGQESVVGSPQALDLVRVRSQRQLAGPRIVVVASVLRGQ